MIAKLILALVLVPALSMAGDVQLDIALTTSIPANVKMLYRDSAGSYPDTSTVGWSLQTTIHNDTYDTGLPAATAVADSGGIVLSWTAATDHDGYRLDFNPNDDGWATVTFPAIGATGFTHEITDPVLPRRGEINYRIRSFTNVATDTTWSAVALLPSTFLNQSVQIYVTVHASGEDYLVASDEESWVFRSSYDASATPPAAPSGLVATAGDATVGLDWTDNGEGDLEDYTIYRGVVSGTRPLLQAGVVPSNYTDNTAVNGTEYFYSVTATDDSNNESAHSSIQSATPSAPSSGVPGTPTHHWDSFTADDLTLSGDVVMAWDDKVGDWDWDRYGTGVTGPYYRAADQLNGHTAVYFDGSSYMRRTTGFIGAADYTICFSYRVDSTDGGHTYTGIWNEGISQTPRVAPIYWNTNFNNTYTRQQGDIIATTEAAASGYHTWIVSYNSSAATASVWLDGVQVVTDDAAAADYSLATRAVIGSMWYGEPTSAIEGVVAEIVVYDATSDNATAQLIDTYFERWD